jgi:endonuclease/exonuclease/phosphatase (EEP) superfamily protein YafD
MHGSDIGGKGSDFFRLKIRWAGLVTLAGVLAGAASILGFLGSLGWMLDICAHFRVQYFLGLGVVALLLILLRKPRRAAVFGVLALANLGMVLPLYFGKPSVPPSGGPPLRAMLVNVNTAYGSSASVADVLHKFNPDIVVLEEVNEKWLSELAPALAGYGYSKQEPREDNFGIALFSRLPFTQSRIVYIADSEVPSILAEIETLQGKCTLMATHPLPPAGRDYSRWRNNQLAQLPGWVHRATSPLLLLGDLNVSPWSSHFRRLLRESGLRDSSQGRGVLPTWPTFSPLLRIPIDHCLYSQGIAIVDRRTGPHVGSDHFPVIVDFVIEADGMSKTKNP